jgi:phosphoglycerate dehydrogenase-like enzyme
MEQVLLSPHIAGWTHQSKLKIAEIMLEKLDKITGII